MVAIKTCKPDATTEERTKFLEEAGKIDRPLYAMSVYYIM